MKCYYIEFTHRKESLDCRLCYVGLDGIKVSAQVWCLELQPKFVVLQIVT